MKYLILLICLAGSAMFASAQDSIQAVFSVVDICDGQEAVFTNTSKVPDKFGSANYTWDFGDGTTSTDRFPTHLYTLDNSTQGQSFTIKLVVQSKAIPSEIDSTYGTVQVFANPNPYFTWDVINKGNTQDVVIDTQATKSAVNFYQWTLAGSLKSNDITPVFEHKDVEPYLDGATYKFTLFVRTPESCEATYTTDFSYNPVGVETISFNPLVSYPNPSNGQINFVDAVSNVQIRTLAGKLVYSHEGLTNAISTDLTQGSYILSASRNQLTFSQRIIID